MEARNAQQPGAVPDAGVALCGSLAHLAASLLNAMGELCGGQSHSLFEPYPAAIGGLRERLEQAETPQHLEGLAEETVALLQEYHRTQDQVDRQEATEVQRMVTMLHETIETLSTGNERSLGRLRRIESDIRSAAQLPQILALKERLNGCLQQIRQEVTAEKRDFAVTKARMEREFLSVQEGVSVAREGVPGREQAEQTLAADGPRVNLVVVVLERAETIKARFGAGVLERYMVGFLEQLRDQLPSPKKLFRWNEHAVVAELPAGGLLESIEPQVRSSLAALPRDSRVDVGQRIAVLENSIRWCVLVVGGGVPREDAIHRIERFVTV
jgi:uncharacterized protein YukE